MDCTTIKYKVVKNPQTHELQLEIYRPYGDKPDEWMMVDRFNDITTDELKCLTDYLLSLWKKK